MQDGKVHVATCVASVMCMFGKASPAARDLAIVIICLQGICLAS